jgi:hypothetical protein
LDSIGHAAEESFARNLFGGDGSFFGQHDGDVVANWINAAADRALQAAMVRERLHVFLANGTDQHFEQFLRQGHAKSPFAVLLGL